MSDHGPALIGVLLLAFFFYFVALAVTAGAAESKCLAAGWREAKVDYALNVYCVKREDQTDIVKPLREVTK